MALNSKQLLFVKEYLIDRNATRAAKAAGYSARCAHSTGPRMLEDAGIKAEIAKHTERLYQKTGLTAQRVLEEIQKLAFVDLSKAYHEDGSLLHPHDMPADVRASLQSVETDEIKAGKGSKRKRIGLVRKIKLSDKVRSLEMLAKHFKLLTDVQEITGKDGGPQVILTLPSNGSEAPSTKIEKDDGRPAPLPPSGPGRNQFGTEEK